MNTRTCRTCGAPATHLATSADVSFNRITRIVFVWDVSERLDKCDACVPSEREPITHWQHSPAWPAVPVRPGTVLVTDDLFPPTITDTGITGDVWMLEPITDVTEPDEISTVAGLLAPTWSTAPTPVIAEPSPAATAARLAREAVR